MAAKKTTSRKAAKSTRKSARKADRATRLESDNAATMAPGVSATHVAHYGDLTKVQQEAARGGFGSQDIAGKPKETDTRDTPAGDRAEEALEQKSKTEAKERKAAAKPAKNVSKQAHEEPHTEKDEKDLGGSE